MTKRYILPVAAVLIIVLGALFYYVQRAHTLPRYSVSYTQPAGTTTRVTTGIASDTVASSSWQTFQEYLRAAKAHDITTLGRLSYKLSDACTDPKQIATCNTRMDAVYVTGNSFKEDDFKNAIYDDRQIILYTDWRLEESNIQIGYGRSLIYFARDASGTPHVLFFTQPEEVVYSFIDPAQTHAHMVARLNNRIIDSDHDTLEDEYETCAYMGASTTACASTSPQQLDTNGDGWWDSIEPYITPSKK